VLLLYIIYINFNI